MSSSFGADALRSAGPSISLDNSGAGGVGTYKGVMLCNRPFGGTEGAAQKASGGGSTFRTGKVPDVVGASNTSLRDKVKRPKKENALTRHRKWLAELQRTKDRLEAEYTLEQIKIKQKTDRFQKQEEQMRKAQKAMAKEVEEASAKGSSAGPETALDEATISTLGSPIYAESKSEAVGAVVASKAASDEKSSSVNNKGAAGNKNKPAWAFANEGDAAEAKEAKEMDDDEGLLDFAAGLDFEKYVDDMEVQTMLAAVAKRIRELEREVKDDDARALSAAERQAFRAQLEAAGEDTSFLDDDATGLSSDGEARAFAKAVLADMEDLKGVHSEKSVAQLYTKAKDDMDDGKKKVHIAPEVKAEVTTNALEHAGTPLIAVHDDSEGARMTEKKSVRKLPYMNRNPAV